MSDTEVEVASILNDYNTGAIDEEQRDEAIDAIAARGRTQTRRVTNLVDRDAA